MFLDNALINQLLQIVSESLVRAHYDVTLTLTQQINVTYTSFIVCGLVVDLSRLKRRKFLQ